MIDPKNVRPVGKHVLLRRFPANESIGSILTPEDRIEKNLKCEVLAVGPGEYFTAKEAYVPYQFKVGDTVLVRQWRGRTLNPHDESILFVPGELVEGVIPQ